MAEMPSPPPTLPAPATSSGIAAPAGANDLIPGNPSPTAEAAMKTLTVEPAPTAPATPENAYVKFYGAEPSKKEPKTRSPQQQLARASWLAPLIVLAVVTPALPVCGRHPVIAQIIGCVATVFVIVGVLCGAGVLRTTYRPRRDGVLAPAALGLCLNGVLVGLCLGAYLARPSSSPIPVSRPAVTSAETPLVISAQPLPKPAPAKAPTRLGLVEAAEMARDQIEKLSGWYGATVAGSAVICIGEFPPATPLAGDLRSRFAVNPQLMLICIDNTRGSKAIVIDPSSLWLESPDGRKVIALPARAVLSGAKDRRDRMQCEFGELRAEPGGVVTVGFAFLPTTADFKTATRLSMQLNGRRIVMSGKHLTGDQKAALSRLASAMASR